MNELITQQKMLQNNQSNAYSNNFTFGKNNTLNYLMMMTVSTNHSRFIFFLLFGEKQIRL